MRDFTTPVILLSNAAARWGNFSCARFFPLFISGVVIGVLDIFIEISFAALIFAGPLAAYVSNGIGLILTSTVIIAVVLALWSSFPATIALPQDIPVAIFALVSSGILAHMLTAGPEASFATVLMAMVVTTVATGITFFLIGRFRLSELARFVPYPVIGGFLGGTGMLLVLGALGVMLNVNFALSSLVLLLEPDIALRWIPGVAFGMTLLMLLRWRPHYLIMPMMVVGATIVFYLVLAGVGLTPAYAASNGWVLAAARGGAIWTLPSLQLIAQVDWRALFSQADKMATVVFISVIALLMNISGLELVARRDIDLDRELQTAGIANVLAGALGGVVGYHALSLSALAQRMSGMSRVVGLVAAGTVLAALLLGADLFSFFPRWVLGGLLFYLGLVFLVDWVLDAWFKLSRMDYILMLAIVIVVTGVGFLEGVVLGILIASVLFVFNYSRVNITRQAWTGETFRSSVERPPHERALLRQRGQDLMILQLQTYIFFGTAQRLLDQSRARLQNINLAPLRFILLDFSRVPGVDSSAVASFLRMLQLTQAQEIELLLTGARPEIQAQLRRGGIGDGVHYFPTLDYGMEWCENQILMHLPSRQADAPATFHERLAQILPSAQDAPRLEKYLERIEMPARAVLMRQGERADALYFIEQGEVSVELQLADGKSVRLRTIRHGTTVGEVALYLGGTRTASVVSLAPTVVYRVSANALRAMERADADLAAALHKWIAGVIAERLADNVRTLEAVMD